MERHLTSHEGANGERRPCTWLDENGDLRKELNPDLVGFGHDGCHPHAHLVVDGLRYDTRRADLVAVIDGRDFGLYLFRTEGKRFFVVRSNYPLRGDRTEPLEVVSVADAKRYHSVVEARSYGALVPYDEVFGERVVYA